AAAVLAVRAARHAIAASPDSGEGYYQLAQAYDTLARRTRERAWEGHLDQLGSLRRAQRVVALRETLTLYPDNREAHAQLYDLCGEAGYVDRALQHLGEVLRLSRAGGPQPGETEMDFGERIKRMEDRYTELNKEVKNRRNRYDVAALNQPPLAKARQALR